MLTLTQRKSSRVLIIAGSTVLFTAAFALFLVSRSSWAQRLPSQPLTTINSDIAIFDVPQDKGGNYQHTKWSFQQDLPESDYPVPKLEDVEALSLCPPHRYKGAGRPVYSTFYATRNATLYDPYFIATQQIVYRLLWDSKRKSKKHPVVVFVAPYVEDEHRRILQAQGAIVREVDLHAYNPERGIPDRFRDIFSKLEIWRHTDFSDMLFLDGDAIPYKNPDTIFDLPVQHCKPDRLPRDDLRYVANICKYRFAAGLGIGGLLNAGVILLRPSHDMYTRIIRDFFNATGKWDDTTFEQGLLNYDFSDESPFPAHRLGKEWNGGHNETDDFYIYHGKLWTLTVGDHAWVGKEYKQSWKELVKFYEDPEFRKLRDRDGDDALKEA